MHSAERINPFPTDIPGLRDAINKKWNINSGPNGGKAPRMYVQDVKNNVPANNIPQKSPGVKEEVKATTPIAEKFAKRQISAGGVFSGAAYAETAREYRTEENATEFDEAYTYGLAGESLNDFAPETATVPLVKAWSAGRQDAKTNAARAEFNSRKTGVSTDDVTKTILSGYSPRVRKALDALGKALGIELELVTHNPEGEKGSDSSYNPKTGVMRINVSEKHTGLKGEKLTGEELIIFVATHEAIHRIRETSPGAYAEMERIALSKSKTTVEERMKLHGETRARATEEIVADYFGDLLSSKTEINTLRGKHRNLFDVLKSIIDKIANAFSKAGIDNAEINEARRLFREALKEADSSVWGEDARSEGEALLSRSEKGKDWRPDLTRKQLDKLMSLIDNDIKTSTNVITKTANWFTTRMNGDTVFAIYSTEAPDNPTLLYESKGEKARKEKELLLKMMEDYEDGKNKSFTADTILGSSGMQQGNSVANSNDGSSLRRGEGRDDRVLQKASSEFNGSAAFRSVVQNLFGISGTEGRGNGERSGGRGRGRVTSELLSRSEDGVKYFPKGEEPRRDIDVPSEIGGKKVMRAVRTVAEAPGVSDEMAEDIVAEIENGRFFYTPSSNVILSENALSKVESDFDGAVKEWMRASGKRSVTDADIALGEALIIEAGKRGDAKQTMDILADVAIAATNAGKVVQAMKLIKRMSPEGQLMYLNKVASKITEDRGKGGKKGRAADWETKRIAYKKEALSQVNPQLHEWLGIVNEIASDTIIPQNDKSVNTYNMQKNLPRTAVLFFMIVGNTFMHSAERINPFPTDIPGLREAINKKWNRGTVL